MCLRVNIDAPYPTTRSLNRVDSRTSSSTLVVGTRMRSMNPLSHRPAGSNHLPRLGAGEYARATFFYDPSIHVIGIHHTCMGGMGAGAFFSSPSPGTAPPLLAPLPLLSAPLPPLPADFPPYHVRTNRMRKWKECRRGNQIPRLVLTPVRSFLTHRCPLPHHLMPFSV